MASPFEPQNPYLAPRGPAALYGAAATAGLYIGALVQFANWNRRHRPTEATF